MCGCTGLECIGCMDELECLVGCMDELESVVGCMGDLEFLECIGDWNVVQIVNDYS